jgi:cytochrome c oxidase subunit 2
VTGTLADLGAPHAMTSPAGPQAAHIDALWWLLIVTCSVVYVIVLAFILWPAVRRLPAAAATAVESPAGERRATWMVVAGTLLTTIILFVFLFASVRTSRALYALPGDGALTVDVTGHQWWWQFEYQDEAASRRVSTANELHIPVGQTVVLKLESTDVIHSFWVPALHGKTDLIPGQINTTWLRADRPGVYRGICAEFCGFQHAKMGFLVVAETPEEFDAWRSGQLLAASAPANDDASAGQQVFMSQSCSMCHTVRGTEAAGTVGPDLTHLASRRTLAAATIPATRGNLAGWIVDPHGIKPGVNMPSNQLKPDELQQLLAFLEGLG